MKKTLDPAMLPGAMDQAPSQWIRVPDSEAGIRLDAFICRHDSSLGLRAVRRKIERGSVSVDSRPCPKGYLVRSGQLVVIAKQRSEKLFTEPQGAEMVFVVAHNEDFAALFKPTGLHSESQKKSAEQGMDILLPRFFPGRSGMLLNRLDQETSGLVLVGLTDQAIFDYRNWQDQGKVRKYYLLLVHGHLSETVCLKNKIDSAKRRKVRVLADESVGAVRFTEVTPIRFFPESSTTLCRAMIFKGQRHQIRAHVGHAGYPIVGDKIYGVRLDAPKTLRLHHERIELPGFKAETPAPWLDTELAKAIFSLDKPIR